MIAAATAGTDAADAATAGTDAADAATSGTDAADAATSGTGAAARVSPRSLHLVLATGGTGGHVFPALAVAGAARAAGHAVTVLGGRGGMEERLARESGVPFVGVRVAKLDRERPDPLAPLHALAGAVEARAALRRLAPHLVVGFGGFASFPGCAAAALTGTPLALHETNAVPGLVTRLFARRADLVVACQEVTAGRLPRARVRVLPFPVREARVPRAAAREALGLPPDALVTLVMGGSQGSLALNDAVPRAYRALPDDPTPDRPHWVLHASGPRWQDALRAATADLPRYRVEGFVDATAAWSAADLAVTRGGYGTLAEAAFHGVPLVVVPLPSAAEDHQRHNARALEADGAGRWVEQGDVEGLTRAWAAMMHDALRDAAREGMRARSPEGGTARLLDTLLPLAAGARTAA